MQAFIANGYVTRYIEKLLEHLTMLTALKPEPIEQLVDSYAAYTDADL